MALTKVDPTVVDDQVFGNRNVIINGEMQISQRGTQTGLGSAVAYTAVDRMQISGANTAGRMTTEQSTDTPDGFANSLKLSCTTADTSIAANEYSVLIQKIEGFNVQRFAKGTSSAKEFTVSFYVKGNAAATYVCELFDETNTRQISKTFAVTTAWNRITLTFPADTTGAFANTSASAMYLALWIHGGSNFTSGTLGTAWAAETAANRAVGISSFFDSTNRTLFLTGVQIETGSQATPFEHRSIGEELALCQRYYFRAKNSSAGYPLYWAHPITTGSAVYRRAQIQLPVEMRVAGTYTVTLLYGGSLAAASNAPTAEFITVNGAAVQCDHATASDSTSAYVYIKALEVDAELP